MTQSIYTERENILPHHAEWLDGCGAKWGSGQSFLYHMGRYPKIHFAKYHWDYCFWANTLEPTHIPTGTEFCERVAEILGLPKPTFAVDISKTETTIKGMAIEVSRLSEVELKYIHSIYTPYCEGWEFCVSSPNLMLRVNFGSKDYVEKIGYTITDSPKVFLEYVEQQTGKEYKTRNDEFLKHFEPNKEEINKGIEKAMNDQNDHAESHLKPTFLHKTYRILDSLDGIPLDTRFKLSEWIPPFGEEVAIIGEKKFVGSLRSVHNCKLIWWVNVRSEIPTPIDGEWMRIV